MKVVPAGFWFITQRSGAALGCLLSAYFHCLLCGSDCGRLQLRSASGARVRGMSGPPRPWLGFQQPAGGRSQCPGGLTGVFSLIPFDPVYRKHGFLDRQVPEIFFFSFSHPSGIFAFSLQPVPSRCQAPGHHQGHDFQPAPNPGETEPEALTGRAPRTDLPLELRDKN